MPNLYMNSPKISVILPVYNCEKFLRQSIESVLTQTFTDFELIIINDGSTDGSESIIQSFKDGRIVYVKNETNLKLIACLNKGIDISRGEYIARMDADDISHKDRFASQFKYLERHKNIGICSTWARIIDNDGKVTGRIKNPTSPDIIGCSLLFTCPLLHPSVMGRSNNFKQFKYNPEALHIEDMDLWSRMSINGVQMANISEYLIDYRWHEDNISVKNDYFQKESKRAILKPRVEELFERAITEDEMNLHEYSFNLYSKGKKQDIDKGDLIYKEKKWLIDLSLANSRKNMFPLNAFDSLVFSRWIVACVANRKFLSIFSFPCRFYRPTVIYKAATILSQK